MIQALTTPTLTLKNHGGAASGFTMDVNLVNTDGTPFAAGATVRPTPLGEAIGNAKTDAKTNVAAAAADAPTKAEYDAFVAAVNALAADYNTLASQFNQLVSNLVATGLVKLPETKSKK